MGTLRVLLTLLLLIALHGNVATAQQRMPPQRGVSFVDRFATFDRAQWFLSNGWVGGDHSDCTLSGANVVHHPGSVELVLKRQLNKLRQFTCGDLQSQRLYGYGTYEVRLRSVAAPGVVTTFFTYVRTEPGGRQDEINFTFLGRSPGRAQVGYVADGQKFPGAEFDLSPDVRTATDYAFEWLPDSIRWFVAGKLAYEVRRTPGKPFPSKPGKIFVSIWNGRGENMAQWLGKFVDPGTPLAATIEHVSFTEMGQPCQFPSSVACYPGANGRRER